MKHKIIKLFGAAYAVVPGTRFLVRLEDELDTRETREKKRLKVTTLEPLAAGSGIYLPPGAEVRAHVSRVESDKSRRTRQCAVTPTSITWMLAAVETSAGRRSIGAVKGVKDKDKK